MARTSALKAAVPPWHLHFEQTALALTAVITDPSVVDPIERLEIACEAPDPELLPIDA